MLLKKPRKVISGYRKASMPGTHNQNRDFSPAKGIGVQKGTIGSSENAIKDKYGAKVCSQSLPTKTLGEHQGKPRGAKSKTNKEPCIPQSWNSPSPSVCMSNRSCYPQSETQC